MHSGGAAQRDDVEAGSSWWCLGVGTLGMVVSFGLLGRTVLAPVLVGAVGFVAGALLVSAGVLRSVTPRPGEGERGGAGPALARLAVGAGLTGIALSLLMVGISCFTGPTSTQLGLLAGTSGTLAGLTLLLAGTLGLRRLARAPRGRDPGRD